MAKKGDTVKVWKWVYDKGYSTEGVVESVGTDNGRRWLKVNGDYYEDANDMTNKCEVIKHSDDDLPAWSVGRCHYCGLPANTFGFFDEPVCRECGG